jgi:serine/threonine-protein kinase
LHFAAGERFGRYEIEGTLGEGGMGAVYRAVDTRLGRRVALKFVRPDRAANEAARAKAAAALFGEARAAATLAHTNAVAIYDVGQEGDTTFIAMELVEGRSLREWIRDGTAPIPTRVRWLRDVARALEEAHARGLVHRDVKPENVMIRADGAVKVLDFGIAWAQGDAPPQALNREQIVESWRSTFTRDGVFVGTPRYMSPEQIEGSPLDGRSDQFSWGVLAYELLAGAPPWLGDAATLGTLFDIVDTEPPPLRKVAPGVPPAVEQVVARALRKKPDERFGSMRAVADALDAAVERRFGARWIALAAVTAFLAAAGVVALRSPGVPGAARAGATPSAIARSPLGLLKFDTPPHIALLLDAAKGVTRSGGVVSRWEDQSGSGNDAVAGTPAPTFVEKGIRELPSLHFDLGQHFIVPDSPSLHFGQRDFVVEVVLSHTRPLPSSVAEGYSVTTSYGMLFGKTLVPPPFEGVALFVNFPHPAPSTRLGAQTSWNDFAITTTDGLNDGRPHLFGARREGTTLEVRLDGVEEARVENASDDVSAIGRPAFIGAQPTEGGTVQRLQGDIAELIVIDGNITPRHFAQLEADLKKKFGL